MSCAKFFSSYKSTVSHTRHDRRQTAAAPAAPAQPEIGAAAAAERKDLLPWPIKTRKRGSSSNPTAVDRAGKEVGISTWGFTDLPPKKRILMAVQARRVDRFMCVVCGRVFEDYHALGGHKSQHTKRPTDDGGCPESEPVVAAPQPLQRCWGGGGRRHCKVLPAFDIKRELPRFDREEETSQDLPWPISMLMMETKFSHSLSCILLLLLNFTHADHHHSAMDFLTPLVGTTKGDSAQGLSKLKNHLSNLGYLNNNNNNINSESPPTHNDLFDDNLQQAITSYQAFFNLPSTGTLDATTLAHMRKPRCGVRDNFPNTTAHYAFFPGNPKWAAGKRYLTYSFPDGTGSDTYRAIQAATKIWAGVSPFKFKYTTNYNAADIKISFQYRDHGDGAAFDGSGGILAHAFAPSDGRLHLDGDERWVNGVVSGEFDLQTIVLHELGHVLGLAHTTDGAAIMYPTIGSGIRKGLGKDDIDGIRALYSS